MNFKFNLDKLNVFFQQEKKIYLNVINGRKYYSFYINDVLQWDSSDEFIYHEIMSIPYLNFFLKSNKKINILILGGGDGFIVKQCKKFDSIINSITQIDFDSEIIEYHKTNTVCRELNNEAFYYDKLNIKYLEAFEFLNNEDLSSFDLIINDLIDPADCMKNTELYSEQFFKVIFTKMKSNSLFITHLGDILTNNDFFIQAHNNIKKTLFCEKNETKFTYFPIPQFGYYGFFSYFKNNNLNNLFDLKLDNQIYLQFLNQNNYNSYLNLTYI